jgi:hypothetical protein
MSNDLPELMAHYERQARQIVYMLTSMHIAASAPTNYEPIAQALAAAHLAGRMERDTEKRIGIRERDRQ